MEYRKLANLNASAVGLGTLRTFDVTSDDDVAVRKEIVDNCLAEDINLIDCASAYGNAEWVVGQTTAGRRDKFYMATKVRCEGKAEGEAQLAGSFEKFGTDYIDLVQVHNMIDWQTHLPTLEAAKEEGRIGLIGLSAMRPEEFEQMTEVMKSGRVDTVQVPYNAVNRGRADDIMPLAQERGIGVLVMEPLQKGRYVSELKAQPDVTPLAEFGIQTWAQALLAWVLGDDRVSAVIPATSKPERIRENAHVGSLGPLPKELRDYVRDETERCL